MKASLDLLENFFCDFDQSNWGYSEQQIAEAEAKLSVSFPKVLKQYYTRFGTCPYIQQEGNNIPVPLDLEELYIPDTTYNAPHHTPEELDFLVFYSYSSVSAIDFGIRLSDLGLEDPPVYFCDYGNTSWMLENTSLLNFLITSAFWQIAYEARLEYSLDVDQFSYDSEELPDLECYITGLGMNDYELENLSGEVHYYRIFLKDSVILASETNEWEVATEPPDNEVIWLTAASTDRKKIQAIKKIPDLLWEENDI